MAGYSKTVISGIVVNKAVNADNATNATSASNATRAVSASYALTASYAMNGGGGGGGTPGGSTTQIQYNNGGTFDGVPTLIYSSGLLKATGSFTGSFTGTFTGTSSWATNVISASYAATASLAPNYVLNSATSSFVTNSQTSSFVTNSQTSSFVTNSQTSSFVQNSQTSSFATTGSNSFKSSQVISGSLTITQDLIVLGSASITNISQSTLNIGTNLITVNTNTPTTRFGGLAVIDSGSSPQRSGSILFDSQNNQWIFVHQSDGVNITSSVFIQGPQTFNNIGNETTLTINKIPKATGGDLGEHIGDSNITDTGTIIQLGSNTQITGSLIISSSMVIGSSSLGPFENTLTLGARDAVQEGGQLGFNASGGTYTSASFIDLYQNRLRILKGTNDTSTGEAARWSMHNLQMGLPAYTSATAFGGTPVTKLAANSNGDILTVLNGHSPQLDLFSALGSTTKADPVFAQGGLLGGSGATLVDGTGTGVAIHVPYQMTVTGVRWYRTITSYSYVADNYNGVLLYSYSGGNLTLVASSSNTPDIWSGSYSAFSATNIYATRSFVSTYDAAPGIYFVIGVHNRLSGTAPVIGSGPQAVFSINNPAYDYTNGAKHFFNIGINNTLPSSIAMSSTTAQIQQPYFALY